VGQRTGQPERVVGMWRKIRGVEDGLQVKHGVLSQACPWARPRNRFGLGVSSSANGGILGRRPGRQSAQAGLRG
jgi:hypothetical protein